MCGLTGFHRRNAQLDSEAATIRRMSDAQTHRGPDDSGHLGIDCASRQIFNPDRDNPKQFPQPVDLLFGFRRLSILDLSDNGHQPMMTDDRKVALMLNGEVYNAFDFLPSLKSDGFQLRSRTDTEVVLNLYLRYGLDGMLERLNGMFAIALYDARVNKLFLARDRYGIKPLYILDNPNYFAFSSELKSFGYLPSHQFQLDESRLDEFLLFRSTLHRTLFKDIAQLQPGMALSYDPATGASTTRFYPKPNAAEAIRSVDDFAACLQSAVKSQMISDVPLGCQLSGGVDSSLVTALAAEHDPTGMNTISILLDDPRFTEASYIDHVEQVLGVQAHRFLLSADYYQHNLGKASWHLEQPIGHPNTVGVMLLSEQARRLVTVLLSGEGADELLAGYPRMVSLMHPWGRPLFSRLRMSTGKRLGLIASYLEPAWRAVTASAFCDSSAAAMLYPPFRAEAALQHRIDAYRSVSADRLTRVRRYEMQTYLPDLLLRQDKMSMASSIENRVPFLDNRLVDSSFTLNSGQLIGKAEGKTHGKKILKALCAKTFGTEFAYRRKQGFGIPIRQFMQQRAFQNMLSESILPGIHTRGIFNFEPIQKIVRALPTTHPANLESLWTMVAFEIWAQRFLDSFFEQDISESGPLQ